MSECLKYRPCRYCGKPVKTKSFFVYCSSECEVDYKIEVESNYLYESNPFIIGDRFMVYLIE